MNTRINIYYQYDDQEKNLGHIETIVFPDRDAIHFDSEKGLIELEPLKDYIGFPLSFIYEDGHIKRGTLTKVDTTNAIQSDGESRNVKALFIDWEEADDGQKE
jgi:hypothetical protein